MLFINIKDTIEKELRDYASFIGLRQDVIDMLIKRHIQPGCWFGHDDGEQIVDRYLMREKYFNTK